MDDTTLFIEDSVEEARNMSTVLDLFTDYSGIRINWVKSALISFKLSWEEEDHCLDALGKLKGHCLCPF